MAGVHPGPVPVHRAPPTLLEQVSRNLLNLHNRDVDHLVNELQLDNHRGLLEQSRPREPASAPGQGCLRHQAEQRADLHEETLSNCNFGISTVRTMGIGLRTTTGM